MEFTKPEHFLNLNKPIGVELKEGKFYFRQWTLGERMALSKIIDEHKDDVTYTDCAIVAHAVCDEKGKWIFGLDDFDKIKQIAVDLIDRLVEFCYELNGIKIEKKDLSQTESLPTS